MEETIQRLEKYFGTDITTAVKENESFTNVLIKEKADGLGLRDMAVFNFMKEGFSKEDLQSDEMQNEIQLEAEYLSGDFFGSCSDNSF